MEVNIKQAQKIFFSKSSFEMIYFEAFANALDAEATDFCIDIKMSDAKDLKSLTLLISDNGVGFDDVRFSKFGKLFDVEVGERSHKGLGRLVYLCYFDSIRVESVFRGDQLRTFTFDADYSGECNVEHCGQKDNGSKIKMSSFSGQKLGKNDFIKPQYIKKELLEKFYMKFYKAKINGGNICVHIKSDIEGVVTKEELSVRDLPDFCIVELEEKTNLIDKIELCYSIKEVNATEKSLITAIAVDDRSESVDIIADENLPYGYEMVFLLVSEAFKGNVDEARKNISIPEYELLSIKSIFRRAIAQTIKKEIPRIDKKNKEQEEYLKRTYPFLNGYFETEEIGYSSQSEVLKKAQEKMFRDQKSILCEKELDDAQFEKSLELSSRCLAQYILFRQSVIEKLKTINSNNKESDIHNIIAPQHVKYESSSFMTDIYRNNVWVLDDKFMSYRTILSEADMKAVVAELTQGQDSLNDSDRPDIVLYFSGDPNGAEKVDVVIVELKRMGLKPEVASDVEIQLETRARVLSKYYDNNIQRIWYYGIVEINDEYIMHLKTAGFVPLFSKGSMYYKSKAVYTNPSTDDVILANTFIMDLKALVDDADCRNETFLKVLRDSFEPKQ